MRLQAPAQRCLRYGACAFLQDTASSTSWSPPPSTPSTRPFPTATTCTPSSTTSPSTCIKNRKESLSVSPTERQRLLLSLFYHQDADGGRVRRATARSGCGCRS